MKTPLKKAGAVLCVAFMCASLKAQTDYTADWLSHFSYTLDVDRFGGDPAVSIGITSPFLKLKRNERMANDFAFTFSATVGDVYGILPGTTKTTMYPYYIYRLGGIERKFLVENKIAVLWEFGGTLVAPNVQFSGQSLRWGGYTVGGAEFYFSSKAGFFMMMGTAYGQPCVADKLVGQPNYYVGNIGFIEVAGVNLFL